MIDTTTPTRADRIKALSVKFYGDGLPWTLAVFRAERVEAEREKEQRSKSRAAAHKGRVLPPREKP